MIENALAPLLAQIKYVKSQAADFLFSSNYLLQVSPVAPLSEVLLLLPGYGGTIRILCMSLFITSPGA